MEKKLLVEASRDHFKSSFFSYGYPLFKVQKVKDPSQGFGIALFSYTENQSRENLKRIRQQIETNEWLKWLLPKSKSSVWDSDNLDCSNGCWIKCYGFGSAFRGRHPKIIVIDDPCKDHGAMSIEQQVQYFSGVIVPAAKSDSQLIVTGNPVDKLDFLEWLERNKAFTKRFYPVLNEHNVPLCPEHYDHAAIEDKRNTMEAHNFAREYLLRRVSAADARFKEEWIHYYEPSRIAGSSLYRIMTIDPALSPGGDALAAVVTGTDVKGNVFVLDRMGFRGNFKEGISNLCDMMVRHDPDFIGIEVFAFQHMYKVWLEEELERRNLNFVVRELSRDTKKSKAARIESLQPKLAQGKLFFLEDHKPLVNQLLLWDPLSKHNDDDECLVAGTMVATPYGDVPIELLDPGDRVITPSGLGTVTAAKMTGIKPVVSFAGIRGTLNHPVFADGEFKSLDALTWQSSISKLSLCQLLRWTYLNLLSSVAGNTLLWGRESIILASQQNLKSASIPRDFMLRFGSMLLAGMFRQAGTFITKTATRLITTLLIWSVYRLGITQNYLRTLIGSGCERILIESGRLQRGGMVLRLALSGIAGMPWLSGRLQELKALFASIVPTPLSPQWAIQNIAPQGAATLPGSLSSPVAFAARYSSAPRKENRQSVLGPAVPALEPVFNLTVEPQHVYYANGVLVSNCDALAWQVPLWQAPIDDSPQESADPLPGSFLDAFEECRQKGDMNYIAKMFKDMAHG